jgi:hypothetical protein
LVKAIDREQGYVIVVAVEEGMRLGADVLEADMGQTEMWLETGYTVHTEGAGRMTLSGIFMQCVRIGVRTRRLLAAQRVNVDKRPV